jgi:hypothetical protein
MIGIRPLWLCFSLVLLLGTNTLANQTESLRAVDPSTSTQGPGSKPLQAEITALPDQNCKFRTHSCEICAQGCGKVTCSSVGIAREPQSGGA